MTLAKLFVVGAVGMSAAACSYTSTTAQAPVPVYRAGSEQACVDYGFQPGTDSYNRCVIREYQARAAGRVPNGYAMAQLSADAQSACYSYGLSPGTTTYDRCVGREMDARRYRDQAYVTPAPTTYPTAYPAPAYPAPAPVYYPAATYAPAPGYTTTTVYTPAPTTYAPAANTPPAGVQAFRDEYGRRYDGQGNRLDGNGNIISPQSTSP